MLYVHFIIGFNIYCLSNFQDSSWKCFSLFSQKCVTPIQVKQLFLVFRKIQSKSQIWRILRLSVHLWLMQRLLEYIPVHGVENWPGNTLLFWYVCISSVKGVCQFKIIWFVEKMLSKLNMKKKKTRIKNKKVGRLSYTYWTFILLPYRFHKIAIFILFCYLFLLSQRLVLISTALFREYAHTLTNEHNQGIVKNNV